MKLYIALFLILCVSGCAMEPVTPVELVEFSVEGTWKLGRAKTEIKTNLISSTASVKDDFLIYPQVAKKMLVTLKRKEIEELIAGLSLIPETMKGVSGLDQKFSGHIFSSYQNRNQSISVQFFKELAAESLIVCILKVKDPAVPNSLYVGFISLKPEKAFEWKQQLEELISR